MFPFPALVSPHRRQLIPARGTRVVIKIESKGQEKKEVVEGMVAWNVELKDGYDLGLFFSSHQSQYATAL